MNIKSKLADFKKELDREIAVFFDGEIKKALKKDKFTGEVLQYAKKFVLAGGKRLRPALLSVGYLGACQKYPNKEEKINILKISIGIELIHAFLLIHDDIMDRDTKRHGIDTLNEAYRKIGKKNFPKNDSVHFGNSIAIVAGDYLAALGNKIFADSNFESEKKTKALTKIQEIIMLTVIGQNKDFCMGYGGKATEEEILKMYEYKTARYTLEGPLHLGAILAGASDKIMENYSQIAVPIGIAFQIQDDILGIFGTEEKLGKSVSSDIQEGKQTILLVKALEKASKNQRIKLKSILGKENLNSGDIETFRKTVIKTGALEYARKKAKILIEKSKKEIKKAKIQKETKDFLLEFADYMATREV